MILIIRFTFISSNFDWKAFTFFFFPSEKFTFFSPQMDGLDMFMKKKVSYYQRLFIRCVMKIMKAT